MALDKPRPITPGIQVEPAGRLPDGAAVQLYTLTNAQGMQARITNFGGIIVSLTAPDRAGAFADVTLGFDTVEEYLAENPPYFNAIIGRYAGRISQSRFMLNGVEYRLAENRAGLHLHGGVRGFDRVVWDAATGEALNPSLRLRYVSRDGEEGYPGNLSVTVTYRLTGENALVVDYEAQTDAPTPINLTQHAYFNLSGGLADDILGHELTIPTDQFAVMGADLVPTGELRPVAGTPMDFRRPTPIGLRINDADEQIRAGGGYDHTWVVPGGGGTLTLAAILQDPLSGRTLRVHTTQPGIHLYTGNFLDGTLRGKGGRAYGPRAGLCLETQHFPDSINKPQFPTTVLEPGAHFRETTVFAFGNEN